MLCRQPKTFGPGGQAFGCGQCLPCRFNKRREWTHRILLEARQYSDNAFISLTYSDEHLPRTAPADAAELVPEHLQLFLKRLRARYFAWQQARRVNDIQRLRFFAVGEYGDETQRPHYHVAAFNFPTCRRGRTNHRARVCCEVCSMVGEAWGLGSVDLGILETGSAQYVAGYVTKKLTHRNDPRLNGRHPEFARMSLRPGIGHSALWEIASELMRLDLDTSQADVPVSLRHGKRMLPLGRYLRRNLRSMIGNDPKAPQAALDEVQAQVRPLRELAKKTDGSWTALLVASTEGKAAALASRSRIYKKRGSI